MGHDEDSEGKVTQILAAVDATPPDLDGTLEMDGEAMKARMSTDIRAFHAAAAAKAELAVRDPATLQMSSINVDTVPSKTAPIPAVEQHTQSYQVPDAVMEQLRHEEFQTLDVALEFIDDSTERFDRTTAQFAKDELAEFTAVIDHMGRIVVPQKFLAGRFERGSKVRVVMRVVEG